jgi:hypothetical protein
VVNQAVEAAEICKGEPTNHQQSQAACPRKRSQSMTIINTSDQPSKHPIMRRLPNSSLTTLLRPSNMEMILVRHSENLSIPILTPGNLPCDRACILAMILTMKLREHLRTSNSRSNSNQSLTTFVSENELWTIISQKLMHFYGNVVPKA